MRQSNEPRTYAVGVGRIPVGTIVARPSEVTDALRRWLTERSESAAWARAVDPVSLDLLDPEVRLSVKVRQ